MKLGEFIKRLEAIKELHEDHDELEVIMWVPYINNYEPIIDMGYGKLGLEFITETN